MSRKILILANIGNRDVLYDGEEVRPARQRGAELLGRFDDIASRIELPIATPALEYIGSVPEWEEDISGADAEPASAGLFYTDQDDPRYRENDTVEFAKIVQRKLLRRSQKEGGPRFAGKKTIRLVPVTGSPARYDDMYSFYRDFFSDNDRIRNPQEWLCFVLTSGGTPAMNAMLILHAVQHFGENCVQIYVSPEGEAHDMRVGEEIVRAATERRVNDALTALQFRAAAEILEETSRGGYRAAACRYAEHRLAFDFYRAERCCREALKDSEGRPRRYLECHVRTVGRLTRGASERMLMIAELFYNLEIKYRCGEFVDVLGRAFRLQEALLTWTVEEYTGIRTGGRVRLLPDQKAAVEAICGLPEYLNTYRTGKGNRLELEREINRVVLMAVTEHLASAEAGLDKEDRERATRAGDAAKGIEALADLRNKTIVAHGFEGVSGERLVEEYGSDGLVEDLRISVGEALGEDLSVNPFLDLAERIRF